MSWSDFVTYVVALHHKMGIFETPEKPRHRLRTAFQRGLVALPERLEALTF